MTEGLPVVVSGPAEAETLRVFRSVVASVAAGRNLPYDRIEELRIAVDEAATMVLRAGGPGTLTMTIEPEDGAGLRVRLEGEGTTGTWPGDLSRSWPWQVISALTSRASAAHADGRPAVSFSMDAVAPGGDPDADA